MNTKFRYHWAEESRSSDFRPLAVALPHPQRKRKFQACSQLVIKKFAYILNGRVFKKIVPRSMIVGGDSLSKGMFKVGEIDNHATLNLTFDRQFDFVGMPVQAAALRVTG